MARYVFITGGVVSSLGKGLASAALGALLQARGYTVRLRKLDRIALVLLGQFKPLMQLLLESAIANLLQDVCVAGFIDFECFATVGADDFVHVGGAFFASCRPIDQLYLVNRARHLLLGTAVLGTYFLCSFRWISVRTRPICFSTYKTAGVPLDPP